MTHAAILYALEQVAAPTGRSLWLYGEPTVPAADVYQPRYDQARALQQKGHQIFSDFEKLGKSYDAVFVHAPQQRLEAEGLIALALEKSKGFVMAVARNDAGGSRLRGMMEEYGIPVESTGKSHCRVVWTLDALEADRAALREKIDDLVPGQLALDDNEWWTVPGLFSWNQVDPGSEILLQHLPPDLSGTIADFGCGYGYLSSNLERGHPGIQQIDAYDIDARAIVCCTRNGGPKVKAIWEDLKTRRTAPLYDTVVMNPPFHTGKDEEVGLGQIFIQKGWESLKPGGRLFLVANRHLAYESVVPGLTNLYNGGGYKILTTTAP